MSGVLGGARDSGGGAGGPGKERPLAGIGATPVDPPLPVDALRDVRRMLAVRAGQPGALLPILHDVQDALGHVPATLVPEIAEALNLSRAEVHGVVTYYHHFRDRPAARHVIRICRAEACQAMGADALLAHAEQRLGCTVHENSSDGGFTLEAVFCLGLCAVSPAIMFDDEPHARMTPAKFDALLAAQSIAAGGACR